MTKGNKIKSKPSLRLEFNPEELIKLSERAKKENLPRKNMLENLIRKKYLTTSNH